MTSSRRLRIAVLNRSFSARAGGAERYSVALVEQLAASHEIHVFAQSIEFVGNQGVPDVTYHHVSLPLRKPRWVNQLWFATATWWATRQGFDVVHSHENTWHGNVQTVHVLPVKYNLFHGRKGWRLALRWVKVLTSPRLLVYLWLERRRYAVQPGRAVVVTSDSLLSIFSVTFPGAANTASVITPGIDLPANLPAQADRLSARQQLGLPLEKRCVLFVGNDFRKKGLQTLIEAMRLMQSDGNLQDFVLAVVGSSAQLPQFRQQAEQAGLADRVFFLGGMADVSPAYRAADVLAHPTLEDTFAMVVLEAMAHGLPVIVSSARYCGISSLLEDQFNALILDNPRDKIALANALARVLGDGNLRTQLGGAARELASRHEWKQVATQQESLYQRVACGV